MSKRISVGQAVVGGGGGGGGGGASPVAQVAVGRVIWGQEIFTGGMRGLTYNPVVITELAQEWTTEGYTAKEYERGIGVVQANGTEYLCINDVARSVIPATLPVNSSVVVYLQDIQTLSVAGSEETVILYPVRLI